MISAENSSTSQTLLDDQVAKASVTSTAAVVSAMMRMKLMALRCAPVSFAIASSERWPASSRPVRRCRPATDADRGVDGGHEPAERDQQEGRREEEPAEHQSAASLLQGEADQDVPLDAEHLLLLGRLGVVEPEQVQDAVGGEQEQLLEGAVAGGLRLGLGDLRAEHDVAEQPGRGLVRLRCRGAARPSGS